MTWWRRLIGRARMEAQLDAEIRDHIEREVAARVRAGMSDAEARRAVQLAFGGVEPTKEACRDARGTRWVEHTVQDVRYALRQLRRQAGFSTVVLLTLVVGIGATTTIFAVVNGVLLRRLPYAEADRLVHVQLGSYSPTAEFATFREHARVLSVGAYRGWRQVTLTGAHEPAHVPSANASPELFRVLGTPPLLGRTFHDDEGRPGASAVVVLSHGLWQERFGGDPGIVGRLLTIDGVPRTVVGVMPATFAFPSPRTALWTPLIVNPASSDFWGMSAPMIGRLRPGATFDQARAELRAFAPVFLGLFPGRRPPRGFGQAVDVVSLHERLVGDVRRLLLVLLAAIGSVMLIVCVNVANLLLTRGMARHHELAIRGALGAGRARLFQQLLVESVTLSLLAGVLATALAFVCLQTVVSLLPTDVPRVEEIGMDARVLAFALGLSLLTGLLFGLLPALRASVSSVGAALSSAGRSAMTGRTERRVSDVLAGVEFALALVLVIVAVLLVKSFWTLSRVDPGFRADRLVAASVVPPATRYPDAPARRRFADELLARVRTLPGVHSAAVGSGMPFAAGGSEFVFAIEGRPDPRQTGVWFKAQARRDLDPDYLQVLGVPILVGRSFTAEDREGAPRVALVSRSLAREHWGDENPLGARIQLPGDNSPWITIVGVVGDVKWNSLADRTNTAFYLPVAQSFFQSTALAIRVTGDATPLAANLRGIVASIDKDAPVSEIRTARELLAASVAQPRFTALLLAAFAAVALFLGAIGIYGVMTYAVSRRTREIGVRIALGASRRDVVRQFLGRGLGLALAGIVVGLCGALAVTRALSGLLFGVQPIDPAVFAGVGVALAVVGLLASYLPARRAARLAPLEALRAD